MTTSDPVASSIGDDLVLRLASWAYLTRFTGSSRLHTEGVGDGAEQFGDGLDDAPGQVWQPQEPLAAFREVYGVEHQHEAGEAPGVEGYCDQRAAQVGGDRAREDCPISTQVRWFAIRGWRPDPVGGGAGPQRGPTGPEPRS